jgi:DhnA family fructose-bisphosphate aldolase class Ia
VVQSVPIPVVIAGGPRMTTDQEVLQMVWESLDAGGAGLSVGRNVFGADNVPRLCRALAGIVHDGLGVADAVDLMHADTTGR